MKHDVLGIRITRDPAAMEAIVALTGEVDLANARQLADAFEGLSDYSKVVLDIRELRYMDSSGLGVLINFEKLVGRQGGRLVVAGASPSLLRLFEVAGLTRLFELVASVGNAAT